MGLTPCSEYFFLLKLFNMLTNFSIFGAMNADKQKVVMSILATGFYEIDFDNGLVYAIRKRGKVLLKTNTLPTRYQQIVLFGGRHTGIEIILYVHQLIYMSRYGMFDPAFEIDHLDRDRSNNKGPNLIAKSKPANSANKVRGNYPKVLKVIRSAEIKEIRYLHESGFSQARIANFLKLNRLSVRYVIKRIEAGLPLKYE